MSSAFVNHADIDGTKDWESAPVPCPGATKGRVLVSVTGGSALVGTVNVLVSARRQTSNAHKPAPVDGYVQIATLAVDATSTSTFDSGVFDVVANAIKLEFKKTSGTGTLAVDLALVGGR